MKYDKVQRFLDLKDFDAYMENYAFFSDLKKDGDTFRKEIQLMESDETYSRREKEAIVKRRKKQIIKELKDQIYVLLEEIEEGGIWKLPIQGKQKIPYVFLYPNDRKGDVNYFLAALFYEPEKRKGNTYRIQVERKDYRLLELLEMAGSPLFASYRTDENKAALRFLITYNRIAAIEEIMRQINFYKEEYRSLHSLPDLKLKVLLQDYHKDLRQKRSVIYQYLIGEGLTSPKWKSEQKAYAIVKKHYPDAVFQYQPDFLFGQRIDIYIPSHRTAIEYQGKQHYEAIDFFGGLQGYKNNKARDERKARRCKAEGIEVLYWDYDQPLDDAYFSKEIMPLIHKDR